MEWLLFLGFCLLIAAVNIQHGSIVTMRKTIELLNERIKRLEKDKLERI